MSYYTTPEYGHFNPQNPVYDHVGTDADGPKWSGTSANEVIRATNGVDHYNAKDGNDIIVYEGAREEYIFSRNEGSKPKVDKFNDGVDNGRDTLSNIEYVYFEADDAYYRVSDLIWQNGDLVTGWDSFHNGPFEWPVQHSLDPLPHPGAPIPVPPTPITPVSPHIVEGTSAGEEHLQGTFGDDIYNGNGGGDFFRASAGDDVFNGDADAYDQVDYQGARSEYTFTRNQDGSVTVTTPEGTDTLNNIEGIWFHGSQEWVSVDELAVSVSTTPAPGTPIDAGGVNPVQGTAAGGEFLQGTDGVDFYFGNGGGDFFSASAGDDIFYGDANAYDQIDYQGARSEYTFTLNANGSITATTPEGTDTLNDIDGIWFHGSQEWIATDDLV